MTSEIIAHDLLALWSNLPTITVASAKKAYLTWKLEGQKDQKSGVLIMSSHVIHFFCVAEVEELDLVDAHQSLQFEPLHQPVRLEFVSESHFSAQSYTSGNYFWLFHRKVHSGVVWATAKNWYQSHSSLVKFRNLKRNRALVHSKENNLFSLSWLVWVSLEM